MTTQAIPFNLTNEALTLIVGGVPRTIARGKPEYTVLKNLLCQDVVDWESVHDALTLVGSLAEFLGGDFAQQDGRLTYKGDPLPVEFEARISKHVAAGEDPSPLLRFFERLQRNPSSRSVEQLWPFLNHQGIPLRADGTFVAYKGLNADLTDCHTGKIDNSPGTVHEMARNKISDDPNHACHFGFHVGSHEYASAFGARLTAVLVDPEHVVCIPYDAGMQKMRVCKYEVLGHLEKDQVLPSTTITDDDIGCDQGEVDDDAFEPEEDDEFTPTAEVAEVAASASKKPLNLRRLARMTPRNLMEETIADLRTYASKLHIIGASKVPGGKTSLIGLIVKARRRGGKK